MFMWLVIAVAGFVGTFLLARNLLYAASQP